MSDHITECIVSFLFTLALIAWDVADVISGKTGAMTWVFLPILVIIGLFEIGAICEARRKGRGAPEKTAEV